MNYFKHGKCCRYTCGRKNFGCLVQIAPYHNKLDMLWKAAEDKYYANEYIDLNL